MQPDLDKYGVSIVALSKDSVEEAAIHKTRDGLSLTLLADPQLEVIRQYGVEHHKALGFTTGGFSVGSIPLALTPSFKTMAIPTSLLVDENGVIQWIDQTDDYRLRSDNSRVLEAVKDAFG
jgi:alkyl hydroperoxide reductase subunit AhpC